MLVILYHQTSIALFTLINSLVFTKDEVVP